MTILFLNQFDFTFCLGIVQTVTVTIFGYAVWSGILLHNIDVSKSEFEALEGPLGQPIINFRLKKVDDIIWTEFISSVGVDSVLN